MFKTPRAVVLALTLLAAAPTVAHADGNARMHWRGLHGTWLGHGGPRSIPAGDGAGWVTFDAATDTLYIANGIANTISVIDAGRCGRHCENPVATLPTGHTPASTFINGRTLYAPNLDDGTLSVYDIATCNAHVISGCGPAVATMPVGGVPLGVTVDAASNSVYVGNAVVDSLAIVDGATCNRAVTSGCTVAGQAATAPGPAFPFIDPATRTLYSPDNGVDTEATGSSVSVIDLRACNAHVLTGCAHPTATVPAGTGPVTGGVDPTTRTVYVTNQADNTVSVIDG